MDEHDKFMDDGFRTKSLQLLLEQFECRPNHREIRKGSQHAHRSDPNMRIDRIPTCASDPNMDLTMHAWRSPRPFAVAPNRRHTRHHTWHHAQRHPPRLAPARVGLRSLSVILGSSAALAPFVTLGSSSSEFFILTPLDYVAIFRDLLGDEGFAARKDLEFHNLNPPER